MNKKDIETLTKQDILDMFNISRTTLWLWIRDKKFPKPSVTISTHKCYWNKEDVNNFLKTAKK